MKLWLLIVGLFCAFAQAQQDQPHRIVTLAPHLAEWVYSLEMGDALKGVSAYSDYPSAAQNIQQIADYNGADIAAIIALEPTLVLVWQGGNKPQDIARLKQSDIHVFISHPRKPEDIARELRQVGAILGKAALAEKLAAEFEADLAAIGQRFGHDTELSAFYYLWDKPLMTIGPNAWANELLALCGAKTLFSDSPVNYPEVSVQEVLRRQPDLLVAASKRTKGSLASFWAPHRKVLSAPLVVADPDALSRYTLRLLPAVKQLCEDIHSPTR